MKVGEWARKHTHLEIKRKELAKTTAEIHWMGSRVGLFGCDPKVEWMLRAAEAEVTGVEAVALATVVPAKAAVMPMAEVVTTPMVAVFTCRSEEAVAVVIVPTGPGVEDPAVVAAVDVKSVSKVVESAAPVVTSPSEVVATAVVTLLCGHFFPGA